MKLNRNRGMFFGSWTGGAVPASATASKGSSTGITDASVTVSTFSDKVAGSGTYEFEYKSGAWTYNDQSITLTDWGLAVTGTAVNGDKIIVSYIAASGGWEALGKDNEDLSKALNPDVESQKNVLGETAVKHSGYSPEIDLDPYYMDPGRLMYDHLLECALEEKYGESDLLGYFAEAFFTSVNEEAQTMSGYCFVRRAWFIPQSVGGDTSGYSIPFNIIPVGPKTKKAISYDMTTNNATITALS